MADPTTPANPAPTPLLATLLSLLAEARAAVGQERVYGRLIGLTLGSLLALGRHTITQLLVVLGVSHADWSGWYRLFSRSRLDLAILHAQVLAEVVRDVAMDAVLPMVLDATQLPRSSRRFPGVGWSRSPRGPAWQRGIHLAQRWEGLSALLPRTDSGDSRAVPLGFELIRSAKSRGMGEVPVRSEGQTGIGLLRWLGETLTAQGRATQPVLVIGDGAYSTAPVIANLPAFTWLLARCAKNRALFALPARTGQPGRPRRYGERQPTPQQTLHTTTTWRRVRVVVRGRTIPLTSSVSGPVLITGAPEHPLFLLTLKGAKRHPHRKRRNAQFFLVSATPTADGGWDLPLPLAALLAWSWQRWEVEVMHRELKTTFGLGDQQGWSAAAAQSTPAWVVWTYAILVLTGYRAWGLGPSPGPELGRWWTPRRWSFARLWQQLRQELWQSAEFQPVWTRSPDAWGEMTTWIGAQTNAGLGMRHI